jgi:putative two-component system response regulator
VRLAAELHPDLMLLDLHMPSVDGFEIMQRLGGCASEGARFPIMVVSCDIAPLTKQQALSAGARDFMTIPLHAEEVLLRIRNLLETHLLYRELQHQKQELEARVLLQTNELKQAQIEILHRLALAAEFRDDVTGQHTQRVGQLAAQLARELGLPEPEIALLLLAAPLHDIGKLGIPEQLLLKPDRLTIAEFEQMKQHTTIGARILSGGRYELLRYAEEIAHSHHERWDGSGYPRGLAGEAIPLASRIVAVADAFDVLTHQRPYKQAWSIPDALQEIARQSRDKFDSRVVDALLVLYHQQAATEYQTATLELSRRPHQAR